MFSFHTNNIIMDHMLNICVNDILSIVQTNLNSDQIALLRERINDFKETVVAKEKQSTFKKWNTMYKVLSPTQLSG